MIQIFVMQAFVYDEELLTEHNNEMWIGVKKSVQIKSITPHCFAWKSLHKFSIQSCVWRVNILLPQLPKISSSLSLNLHSILCFFTLNPNKTLLAHSIFFIVHIHCLFPLVIYLLVCLCYIYKMPNRFGLIMRSFSLVFLIKKMFI